MNAHVNISAGRSLRAPQHESLEILARVTELISLQKGTDRAAALAAIRSEFPSVEEFERDFIRHELCHETYHETYHENCHKTCHELCHELQISLANAPLDDEPDDDDLDGVG